MGSKFSVAGFESRPRLTLFPGPGASSRRPMNFYFVEAVQRLHCGELSDEDKAFVYRVVSQGFKGSLRETFIILTDDEREKFTHKPTLQPPTSSEPRETRATKRPHEDGGSTKRPREDTTTPSKFKKK